MGICHGSCAPSKMRDAISTCPTIRGQHSSTVQLNVSIFCGMRWVGTVLSDANGSLKGETSSTVQLNVSTFCGMRWVGTVLSDANGSQVEPKVEEC